MKKHQKVKHLWLVIVLMLSVVGGFLGLVSTVKAADVAKVNVTLNKRQWEKGQMPSNIQNTGEEMDFGGAPLQGVTFTAYDVTEKYHQLVMGSTPADALATIQSDATPMGPSYGVEVAKVTTDANGQAVFTNLNTKTAAKDSVYVFVETELPTSPTIIQKAVPIVLTLPVYKITMDGTSITYTDEINSNIQLYPKNEIAAKNTKVILGIEDANGNPVDMNANGGQFNITTGDVVTYQVNVTLPADIAQLESFKIKDKPSEFLKLLSLDTLVVKASNALLVKDMGYTVVASGEGFELSVIPTNEVIKNLAGQTLTLQYKMKLVKEINPDEPQINKAEVEVKGQPGVPIDPPEELTTGGKKFLKVDEHTNQALAGAEFIVKSGDNFAVFGEISSSGEYVFTKWVSSEAEATTLVSDAQGLISIKGLKDGGYQLIETKAPSDKYIKLSGPIDFEVVHGQYNTEKINVKNTPKGLLPATGGKGIYGFAAVGLAIAGAGVVLRRRKEESNV